MTLSLFLVIPTITYLAWQLTQGSPPRVTLDYTQRADWFLMPVKPRPLTYNTFVAAETGKKYKRTDLSFEPEAEARLQRCVAMAQADDFFTNAANVDKLKAIAAEEDAGFYPAYLLGCWYQEQGDRAAYEQWMQAAFTLAGGAIVQKLVDEEGDTVADFQLPPVAIGYDRVIDGQRDATLVLIYPGPVSDADGYVRLPTFRSVYRLTDPALPPGVDPGQHPRGLTFLPQANDGPVPNWFAVPDGAVGRFEDAVVRPK